MTKGCGKEFKDKQGWTRTCGKKKLQEESNWICPSCSPFILSEKRKELYEEIITLMVGFMDLNKITGYLIPAIKRILDEQDKEAIKLLKEEFDEIHKDDTLYNGADVKFSLFRKIDKIFGDLK